jgi:hypothetical protein
MSVFKRFSKYNSRKQSKEKTVRFMNDEDIHQFEMFENRDDIWFSRVEERDFKERDLKMGMLLQEMDPAELEFKTGESPRGLEHTPKKSSKIYNQRRASSVLAVVATQDLFRNRGEDGGDSIARAYGLVSTTAVRSAIARAERDERFVVDHVRVAEPVSRIFEKRSERPSLMGRRPATRSVASVVA